MFRIRTVISFALALMLAALGLGFTGAQARAQTAGGEQMKQLVKRLEANMDRFKRSADTALDGSRLNNSDLEDQINARVAEVEYAADRLEDRADDGVPITRDVNEVLGSALRLELFMQTHRLSPDAERDWAQVRNVLDRMARAYNVAWVWSTKNVPPMTAEEKRRVLERIETRADEFRDSFDDALDKGRADGTRYEDHMNRVVAAFEESLDNLENQMLRSNEMKERDVLVVLNNALAIEDFMRKYRMTPRAWLDWSRVKLNLDDLARMNNVAWVWTLKPGATGVTAAAANTNTGATNVRSDGQAAQAERVGMTGGGVNRTTADLAREVRHELLSDLPYYGVFDWIEFEVRPDQTVVLRGHVTSPPDTKSRAEAEVRDIAGVRGVVNEIEVLPVSPGDERLRRELYRAIYDFNSPLFKYGVGSRQSIHIIVKNGRVTLEGVVDNEMDKQLAYTRARGVSGAFGVDNQLRVDGARSY